MEYKDNVPKVFYNQTKAKLDSDKWWTMTDTLMFDGVFSIVKRINANQSYRSLNNLRFSRLYANSEVLGLKPGNHARVADPKTFMTNRVTYNVVKANIDSACARISKEKPRPIYITEGGSWTLQQKSKRLSQYVQGVFSDIGTGTGENKSMYGIGRQAFRDACLWGTGPTHFYTVDNKIKAKRVMSDEIIIDDEEGFYGNPRQMFRQRFEFKEVLKAKYPDKAKFIDECDPVLDTSNGLRISNDLIEVIDSWRLPSSEGGTDGRYAVCINNCTLNAKGKEKSNTSYAKDYYPFLFQRWSSRPTGFYGQGLAEELIGIQLEINKILRVIAISQHLTSVPQVWLEMTNMNNPKQINNEIGGQKYYRGQPPIFTTNQAVNPELYAHLERLYQRSFEISGTSQLSATGQKPAGLDAGVALREYRDIEQERFSMQQNMYEDYFMDASAMILDMSRDLSKEGLDPVVQYRDGNSMKKISFKDVDIADDKFVCRAYPTNFLPSTPAGKMQTVQEMVQGGMYTQEEGLDLLDFPDLQKTNNLKLAPKKDIYKIIEFMIEKKKLISPEPYMNLQLAKTLSQSYYLNGKCDDMPQDIQEILRQFMNAVDDMLNPPLPENVETPAIPTQEQPMLPDPSMVPTGGIPAPAVDPNQIPMPIVQQPIPNVA